MHATTAGVDLAKNHFELAVADEQFRVGRRERLSRIRFSQFFGNHPPSLDITGELGHPDHQALLLSSTAKAAVAGDR